MERTYERNLAAVHEEAKKRVRGYSSKYIVTQACGRNATVDELRGLWSVLFAIFYTHPVPKTARTLPRLEGCVSNLDYGHIASPSGRR